MHVSEWLATRVFEDFDEVEVDPPVVLDRFLPHILFSTSSSRPPSCPCPPHRHPASTMCFPVPAPLNARLF